MDIIDNLGIKVPNAVLVCGLTESEKDEEILDFLKRYGSFKRTVKIDDPTTEFHTNLIVEYNHGTAVQALEPLLPYTHSLTGSPDITYRVRALASVYTQKVGSDVIQAYQAERNHQAQWKGFRGGVKGGNVTNRGIH